MSLPLRSTPLIPSDKKLTVADYRMDVDQKNLDNLICCLVSSILFSGIPVLSNLLLGGGASSLFSIGADAAGSSPIKKAEEAASSSIGSLASLSGMPYLTVPFALLFLAGGMYWHSVHERVKSLEGGSFGGAHAVWVLIAAALCYFVYMASADTTDTKKEASFMDGMDANKALTGLLGVSGGLMVLQLLRRGLQVHHHHHQSRQKGGHGDGGRKHKEGRRHGHH